MPGGEVSCSFGCPLLFEFQQAVPAGTLNIGDDRFWIVYRCGCLVPLLIPIFVLIAMHWAFHPVHTSWCPFTYRSSQSIVGETHSIAASWASWVIVLWLISIFGLLSFLQVSQLVPLAPRIKKIWSEDFLLPTKIRASLPGRDNGNSKLAYRHWFLWHRMKNSIAYYAKVVYIFLYYSFNFLP